MSNDSLGDRMKDNYEDRYRIMLPRRSNIIIRVDGKAFHTYTRNCKKPFDDDLMRHMDATAVALCKHIQGAKIAYVQSDEISVWVTDYERIETDAWFDNNLQKMVSVSSSVATAEFNRQRIMDGIINTQISEGWSLEELFCAHFDARAFVIPELAEVANYFLWRCQDATRNSVQMVARSLYSHKECDDKSNIELQKMIAKVSQPWISLERKYRHGRIIRKTPQPGPNGIIERWTTHDVDRNEFSYWQGYLQMLLPKEVTS